MSEAKPKPRKAGRKSKFTAKLVLQLATALSVGAKIKDACSAVGITVETYEKWLQVGEALREGRHHPDKPRPPKPRADLSAEDLAELEAEYEATLALMEEFPEKMEKARSQAKIQALTIIKEAAKTNWTAAAWFLERTDPETYGRRFVQAEHSGTINHQHSTASKLSDEELAQIASGAKKKGKPSGDGN